MLFTSERKSDHLTFISASSRAECSCYLLSKLKTKHPTFIKSWYKYGVEYYCYSSPNVKVTIRHLLLWNSIFLSWMLLLFSFERKSKHPAVILSSYGLEYYYYSFPIVKANIRHSFQHLPEPIVILIHFQTQNQISDINFSTVRSLILPLFISKSMSKDPTFILVSYGVEYYRYSFPKLKANIWHLF